MSAKNRATGDTEDKFQAALVTYTKAGNKTAAMRRLWNTAYEMGKSAGDDAVFEGRVAKDEPMGEKKRKTEEARQMGFEEGRRTGFEEGRQAGERDALSMDVFDVSFGSGKMAGIAMGMELGREAETQRWKDGGHFEDGTCRTFTGAVIVDSSSPPQSLPLDDAAGTFPVYAELNWANDAESLLIHSILFTPQPRDFSDLHTAETSATTAALFLKALHRYLGFCPASASNSVRLTGIQIVWAAIVWDLGVDMVFIRVRVLIDRLRRERGSGGETGKQLIKEVVAELTDDLIENVHVPDIGRNGALAGEMSGSSAPDT
ncbi:hypothetical protein DFH08DRAFT_972083 [Mycena albidolilacea]|uniref:Essential protein Yae1 N-terminal domain-containing protein n=1 Tax=Mycena albidolilacea TaxID=1033008 RepID=A0AAD7EEG6_9AGAR|nr:hypothetical protein DFH08DRAFT_972083 [Mycena albidolilacea]